MKKNIVLLFLCFAMSLAASSEHNHTVMRATAVQLTLMKTKIPNDLIEDINKFAKTPKAAVCVGVRYEPLYKFFESAWFTVHVPQDMTLVTLHDALALKLKKNKEHFKIIKRGVVENTPLNSQSTGELASADIDSYTHLLVQEIPH